MLRFNKPVREKKIVGDYDAFMKIPGELRNMVYNELFFNDGHTFKVDYSLATKIAMLSTSRLYRMEAGSFFYSRAHLVIPDYFSPARSSGSTILPPVTDAYVHRLKRVTLSVRSSYSRHIIARRSATLIGSLAKTGATFDEVNIAIQRAHAVGLTRLLNTRFDDSILPMAHPIVHSLIQLFKARVSKIIRIYLSSAWFSVSVAYHLEHTFRTCNDSKGHRLQFFFGTPQNPGTEIRDIYACERAHVGRYWNPANSLSFSTWQGSGTTDLGLSELGQLKHIEDDEEEIFSETKEKEFSDDEES